jgi:hypothetical protein
MRSVSACGTFCLLAELERRLFACCALPVSRKRWAAQVMPSIEEQKQINYEIDQIS